MEINNNFKYWFMHWCAYQLTAMKLNCWHIRFLFHDIEKPLLQIFLSHKTVSNIHRKTSRHHVEYFRHKNYDIDGMIVDWECSSLSKSDKPLNARDTLNKYYPEMREIIEPKLKELGL